MSPITRKGSQHGARTGRWKKCVVPLSCWDIQQAPQDCTGKALERLDDRNTGWNPNIKERNVIKMRKCTTKEVFFLNHLPFAKPRSYHLILDGLLLPCTLKSPWVGQDDGGASPSSFLFPLGLCLLADKAQRAHCEWVSEVSEWAAPALWQSLSSITGIGTVAHFCWIQGRLKRQIQQWRLLKSANFASSQGKKGNSLEQVGNHLKKWIMSGIAKLLYWKIKVRMPQNPIQI